MSRLDLAGRTAVVTGGAAGIGLAVARECAARGATCAIFDVAGAADAARHLGGPAFGLTVDVTDLEGLETACAEVVRRTGGIDVLVVNAGIGPHATTVDAGDRDHQRRVLDVNVHGSWHTVWAGVPHVIERRGHVAVVSSVGAFISNPGSAAYGASKAAVEVLARSQRIELASTGTSVGVAHFGLIDTALVRQFDADPLTVRLMGLLPRPLRGRASAEDAARVLVDDIERRAPRTIYPRAHVPAYALRGVLGPVSDAILTRSHAVQELVVAIRERDAMARHPEDQQAGRS